ncbi:hypothetical protein [Chryseobacterium chendengshani]|uniref:hypothetical protein n=1 Tax=Chryseobacterium sp. LJ756 TaxID=2864113 RepID=UPI001C63DA7D|nr:hypothetical protein [Chryseobacterium sp. LJ756]MBW7674805.1 hypothetical protein [Chryseobacterium sp. LJ756]
MRKILRRPIVSKYHFELNVGLLQSLKIAELKIKYFSEPSDEGLTTDKITRSSCSEIHYMLS